MPREDYTVEINKFDGFNRLIQVQNDEGTSIYLYKADGLRLSKTVNDELTTHVYDGSNVVMEFGAVNDVYLRGINLIKSNAQGYYLFNAHGDVVQRADGSGAVTKAYVYDAFGVESDIDENDTNPFRYCAEYFDQETGSIYLRARYYDPTVGGFMSEDPIRDGLNWYTYCMGNPTAFVDPTGESVAIAGAATVYVVSAAGAVTVAALSWVSSPDGQRAIQEGATIIYEGAVIAGEAVTDVAKEAVDSLVTYVPSVVSGGITRHRQGNGFLESVRARLDSDSKLLEIALSSAFATTTEKTGEQPEVIYRTGSGNGTNLTPRQQDISGLSYQLTMPTSGKYTMLTIDMVNATGFLVAVQDGPNHVSILPIDITKMQEWIDSRPTALTTPHFYTQILQGLSIKVG
jgi:RHS repeat-associated protein